MQKSFHRAWRWKAGIAFLALLLAVATPVLAQFGGGSSSRSGGLSPSEAKQLLEQLEADRLLLAELRKPLPLERTAAEVYLQRVRELATISDPVRLPILVHKVIQNAPLYFDWVEKEYDNANQRMFDYYLGGARDFHTSWEEFKTGVYLTMINRLDVLADVVEDLAGPLD